MTTNRVVSSSVQRIQEPAPVILLGVASFRRPDRRRNHQADR
jgi:hypothetical protein